MISVSLILILLRFAGKGGFSSVMFGTRVRDMGDKAFSGGAEL